jgi:hypothetical protein
MPDDICSADAAYRYTWPGRDESFICEEHSQKLIAVATAMGLHLQLIPMPPETTCCMQKVSR